MEILDFLITMVVVVAASLVIALVVIATQLYLVSYSFFANTSAISTKHVLRL